LDIKQVVQHRQWPSDQSSNPVVLVLGKRHAGKTTVVHDILSNAFNIHDSRLVISTSCLFESNEYGLSFPNAKLMGEYDGNQISKIMENNRDDMEANSYDIEKRIPCYYVFDSCDGSISKMTKDKSIKELFYNGRHMAASTIITNQTPLSLPPSLRDNVDWVFIVGRYSAEDKRRIYNNYGGMFDHFNVFEKVMDTCTENGGCLVINTSEISENIYWYKAQEHTKITSTCSFAEEKSNNLVKSEKFSLSPITTKSVSPKLLDELESPVLTPLSQVLAPSPKLSVKTRSMTHMDKLEKEETLQVTIDTLMTTIDEQKEQIEKVKFEIDDLNQENSMCFEDNAKQYEEVERLKSKKETLENNVLQLTKENSELEKTNDKLVKDNNSLELKIDKVENEKDDLDFQLEEIENENHGLRKQAERLKNEKIDLEEDVEELRLEKEMLELTIDELKNDNDVEDLNKSIDALQEDNDTLRIQKKLLMEELEDLTEEVEIATDKLLKTTETLNQEYEKNDILESDLERTTDSWSKTETTLANVQKERDLAKLKIQNLELDLGQLKINRDKTVEKLNEQIKKIKDKRDVYKYEKILAENQHKKTKVIYRELDEKYNKTTYEHLCNARIMKGELSQLKTTNVDLKQRNDNLKTKNKELVQKNDDLDKDVKDIMADQVMLKKIVEQLKDEKVNALEDAKLTKTKLEVERTLKQKIEILFNSMKAAYDLLEKEHDETKLELQKLKEEQINNTSKNRKERIKNL
jgi:predicted  nucleic acid-binding Zn-ribbon protein